MMQMHHSNGRMEEMVEAAGIEPLFPARPPASNQRGRAGTFSGPWPIWIEHPDHGPSAVKPDRENRLRCSSESRSAIVQSNQFLTYGGGACV